MPHRLSPRAGERSVGLGRQRKAGYQTGRVACMARCSRTGEAWRRSAESGPATLLPRCGSAAPRAGGIHPILGAQLPVLVRPANPCSKIGTAILWTHRRSHAAVGTRPRTGVLLRNLHGGYGLRLSFGMLGAYVTCRGLSIWRTGPAGLWLSYPRDSLARAEAVC